MTAISATSIREAALLFGITDNASLNEIKRRYREYSKEWHPDVSDNDAQEAHIMFIKIQGAYDLLVEYCMNYKISFQDEDILKDISIMAGNDGMERFRDDPIWG